jgi:type I restriction enzyme S subunit
MGSASLTHPTISAGIYASMPSISNIMSRTPEYWDTLDEAFSQRYPHDFETHNIMRKRGLEICENYIKNILGDRDSGKRLRCKNNDIYWQQLSEVLTAHIVEQIGLSPTHRSAGPDLLIELKQTRAWIEVICPTPTGVPDSWLNPPELTAYALPHEALLLRWTSALKEKAEKLIGSQDGMMHGYIAKGVVSPSDIYVIAINGRLLRNFHPQLEGISQFPFAVEATLSVGQYAININRETLDVVDRGHQYRPAIFKKTGAAVPADTFLDPRFSPISAIWAMDFDEGLVLGRQQPMAIVHNPAALNPLPEKLLPSFSEYKATIKGELLEVTRNSGSLL